MTASVSPCDCPQDGWCQRYRREMRGRMRDICRNIDVDIGEAALLRRQWLSEAGASPLPEPPAQADAPRKIILKNFLSPGDVLVMSAAIYSLHAAHPGKFVTAVDTAANSLYDFNPNVVDLGTLRAAGAEEVQTHYPDVSHSNGRAITFMHGYCNFFAETLGVPVPLLTNRPHVHLSREERQMDQVKDATGVAGPYWLVCAGGKNDFTAKDWGASRYQRVVDALAGKVRFVQVGSIEHRHPPLSGALNFIGKTSLRQLVRLCARAEGVLCGVTLLQHLAAALEKPSVVILGGREPVVWNSYPKQHTLHTVGSLPCCKNGGCWRSRTVPLGDGEPHDRSLCEQPVGDAEKVPRCMEMIPSEEVIEKILRICS